MDLNRLANIAAPKHTTSVAAFDFSLKLGLISSTLEHSVPERMHSTAENPLTGISAAKAIFMAHDSGQRIFHIMKTNETTALSALNLTDEVLTDIEAALQTGREVITHTDPVHVPGWTGAGYIILDPNTGDAAYKITGGYNGGFADYSDALLILFPLFMATFFLVPPMVAGAVVGLILLAAALLSVAGALANQGKTLAAQWLCYTAVGLLIVALSILYKKPPNLKLLSDIVYGLTTSAVGSAATDGCAFTAQQ